ncbi:Uu.00g016480.m01.CDS01 [Anthostomella pinea]|uniref:Uu.00g016480.m01.CDS01 n=1 Tax=Anthostomella pinea TaxID=933095 RepID=A0AAI8VZD3_9PEZI|nr:Uu.00g016480.m01.CDS01 [Anthostomella pinea]
MLPLVLTFLALGGTAFAADCNTDQERQDSTPSGSQIQTALTSNDNLDTICGGTFLTGSSNQLENSFSHGSVQFEIKRTDSTVAVRYCQEAFSNIIDQCVTGGNYWGGTWSLNGEIYSISNTVYPDNPLLSTDDGGPSSDSSSTTSATSATSTTSTDSSATTTTADTGPITPGPQTSTESGTFSTTTESIDGLTSNSVTTTTLNDGPTILPIWYVSAGVGILLIPGSDVVAGGIVPPPPGYPAIIINSDGDAETISSDGSSTTTTSTSSCSSCSSCVGLEVLTDDILPEVPNDGDPDLPDVDTAIWASLDALTTSTTSSSTQTTVADTPTQTASPIDDPGCQDADADVQKDFSNMFSSTIRTPDGKDNSIDDLLYRLREVVCDGSCTAPDGIDSKYVGIYNNGQECEVAIGVTNEIEVYFYRSIWPTSGASDYNTLWQECWDSTSSIITKCVNNKPKHGWWNGDHVYQYYEGGVRALYDQNEKHSPIGSFLEPPTEGLSCDTDCCGAVPNPDWCNANCGGTTCKRGDRYSSPVKATKTPPVKATTLERRAKEVVTEVGGCPISYTLPNYPAAASAAKSAAVQKWYDEDKSVSCDNPTLSHFTSPPSGSKWNTEHVWEKHMVKRFFYYLLSGQQAFDNEDGNDRAVASCDRVQAAFNTVGGQGSQFQYQTAAQQLGAAISCSGRSPCPASDGSRLSEFFLLRDKINKIKNQILTGYYDDETFANENSDKLPSCSAAKKSDEQQQMMIAASLAFQYMQREEVFDAFNVVNERMKAIVQALDADRLGIQYPPQRIMDYANDAKLNGWTTTYTEFMNHFLADSERKMQKWMYDCRQTYTDTVNGNATLQQSDKDAKLAILNNAVYQQSAMSLGSRYNGIRDPVDGSGGTF